ncbi:MAG: DUF6090 family protein [Bacteroidota bacterium]
MLNYLRKVRQGLIMENRVKKYITYAAGEILLVVIGILVALQINNWNEVRKEKINEIYILTELESNLEEESTQIDKMLLRRSKAQYAMTELTNYLPDGKVIQDSFEIHVGQMMTFERYFPIRNAYEISKANGLKISNKKLRTLISRYYELEQYKVQKSIEDIEKEFLDKFAPLISSTRTLEGKYATYIKFANIEEPEFLAQIYEMAYGFQLNHAVSYETIKVFNSKTEELLLSIQKELKAFQ